MATPFLAKAVSMFFDGYRNSERRSLETFPYLCTMETAQRQPELQKLTITKSCSKLLSIIPNKIFINGRFVGITQKKSVSILIPKGNYSIMIQSIFPFLYATDEVEIEAGVENVVIFKNRERFWDILFTIDIIFWIAGFFFTLPKPWDLVYDISTNTILAIWLIYEYCIRKKYYLISQYKAMLR